MKTKIRDLKVGDVVLLENGRPAYRVTRLITETCVEVQWFDGGRGTRHYDDPQLEVPVALGPDASAPTP